MYKFDKNRQAELTDFNQPLGMKLNPDNRWVKKADMIPWDAIEEKYAELFPSKTGMPAKPLREIIGVNFRGNYIYKDNEGNYFIDANGLYYMIFMERSKIEPDITLD